MACGAQVGNGHRNSLDASPVPFDRQPLPHVEEHHPGDIYTSHADRRGLETLEHRIDIILDTLLSGSATCHRETHAMGDYVLTCSI